MRSMAEAVEAALLESGRLGTVDGVKALEFARQIDEQPAATKVAALVRNMTIALYGPDAYAIHSTCPYCGVEYTSKLGRSNCGSSNCKSLAKGADCSGCGKRVHRSKTSRPDIVCRDCQRGAVVRAEYVCEWCGDRFTPKTQHRSKNRPPRFCSISHFKRWTDAQRGRGTSRRQRICEWCGDKYDASYKEQRTCSRECGAILRHGAVWEWRTPVSFPLCQGCGAAMPPRTRATYCSDRCRPSKRVVAAPRACADCGCQVSRRQRRCPMCSAAKAKEVRKAAKRKRHQRDGVHLNKHRKRARHYGVAYEVIRPREVFERDGWMCGICGDPVDPTLKAPDLMCASLDHIVPMSKGGGHVWDNVQLAHFLCNSYKGADESMAFRVT